MPILQEGFNFPNVLGKLTFPPAIIRQGPIAQKAMALIAGETPIHLAQKLRAQLSDRPHPYLDKIKSTQPLIGRTKLIGTFGIIDPCRTTALRKQIGIDGNIPNPNPRPSSWPTTRDVSTIPAVVADIRGASGPERTMRGSLSVVI